MDSVTCKLDASGPPQCDCARRLSLWFRNNELALKSELKSRHKTIYCRYTRENKLAVRIKSGDFKLHFPPVATRPEEVVRFLKEMDDDRLNALLKGAGIKLSYGSIPVAEVLQFESLKTIGNPSECLNQLGRKMEKEIILGCAHCAE